jgi:hypothetical protein
MHDIRELIHELKDMGEKHGYALRFTDAQRYVTFDDFDSLSMTRLTVVEADMKLAVWLARSEAIVDCYYLQRCYRKSGLEPPQIVLVEAKDGYIQSHKIITEPPDTPRTDLGNLFCGVNRDRVSKRTVDGSSPEVRSGS